MREDMNTIVEKCLLQHKGGEVFFDHLDDIIRNNVSLMDLMIQKISVLNWDFIIVSGNFGIAFSNYCNKYSKKKISNKIVAVPGGLRNGMPVGTLPNKLSNKKGIFIDDSFYLGRTHDAIAKELKIVGASIIGTYVFYDGSKELDKTVHSFYRYYK